MVRPALLRTDLPVLISYLELDGEQEAAVRALLQDQLDADEQSMAALRTGLRHGTPDDLDTLASVRERWGQAWDRFTYPSDTEKGRTELRAVVEDYLGKVEALPANPSQASDLLGDYARNAAEQRTALIEDLLLLLDDQQQHRLLTAHAAVALARSSWPALFGEERLDLDALLVTTLAEQSNAPEWIQRRALWLRIVGDSIVERDHLLAAIEPALIDASIRRQPGRSVLLTRHAIAAHLSHAEVLKKVRAEMSLALAEVGLVNPFQRAAHRRMYPELYEISRVDRLFDAAVAMPDLDGERRAMVNAARTRHRNRTFFVQSHLTAHGARMAEYRLLRRHESSLLARLFGTSAGMLSLDPALDVSSAEVTRLQRRMDDARVLAEAELKTALPEGAWAEVHNRALRAGTAARDAHIRAATGTGRLSLPQRALHAQPGGDEPKP